MRVLTEIATILADRFKLRSGHADGADMAFENGSLENNEIWIPWLGFNGSASQLLPSPEAFDLAATIHPAWKGLGRGAKALHARNCHQVLGVDLNTPSDFLLAWTLGGEVKGGTATAIRLAERHDIPILNLGKYDSPHRMRDAFSDFMILTGN